MDGIAEQNAQVAGVKTLPPTFYTAHFVTVSPYDISYK
jgi:hypothetical protein